MSNKQAITFPTEIAEQVKDFHLNLNSLKKELEPILNQLYDIKDFAAKDPIKSATLELTLCQAINSLFYMYLQTTGTDARSHSIGHELYRIEKYMKRLDLINHKLSKPKLNAKAAQAFVRNALFDESEQMKTKSEPDVVDLSDDDDTEPMKRQKID